MIDVSGLSKVFNDYIPGRLEGLNRKLFAVAARGDARGRMKQELLGLLKRGAEINKPAADGSMVLNIVAAQGLKDVVEALVETGGADVKLQGATGTSPVKMAAWAADEAGLAYLLGKGADATAKTAKGEDALFEILHGGSSLAKEPGRQLACLKLLVAHGVTLSPEDKTYVNLRRTDLAPAVPEVANVIALEKAIKDGKLKDAQNLLALKTDPEGAAAFGGDTAMYFAAAFGRVEIIKSLKEAGADVNAVSQGCQMLPLQAAVKNGWRGAVETLIELGADPLAKTPCARTIIDYARISEDKGMEDYLMTLLAKHFEAPEPDVALTEKITTMPKLRLKNATL